MPSSVSGPKRTLCRCSSRSLDRVHSRRICRFLPSLMRRYSSVAQPRWSPSAAGGLCPGRSSFVSSLLCSSLSTSAGCVTLPCTSRGSLCGGGRAVCVSAPPQRALRAAGCAPRPPRQRAPRASPARRSYQPHNLPVVGRPSAPQGEAILLGDVGGGVLERRGQGRVVCHEHGPARLEVQPAAVAHARSRKAARGGCVVDIPARRRLALPQGRKALGAAHAQHAARLDEHEVPELPARRKLSRQVPRPAAVPAAARAMALGSAALARAALRPHAGRAAVAVAVARPARGRRPLPAPRGRGGEWRGSPPPPADEVSGLFPMTCRFYAGKWYHGFEDLVALLNDTHLMGRQAEAQRLRSWRKRLVRLLSAWGGSAPSLSQSARSYGSDLTAQTHF